MYGGTKVHATHVMATHFLLQKHFCTFCRAYGSQSSKYLQRPCPKVPKKAGLEALKLISRGIRPDIYKETHVARHGKQSRHRNSPRTNNKVKLSRNSLNKLRHHLNKRKNEPAGRLVPIEPPSLFSKGPKAEPCNLELNSEDLAFVQLRKHPRYLHVDSLAILESKDSSEFSESGVGHANALLSDCTPSGSQPSVVLPGFSPCSPPPPLPFPPRRLSIATDFSHAECSQHGRNGSWTIADFCSECNRIAEAATAL